MHSCTIFNSSKSNSFILFKRICFSETSTEDFKFDRNSNAWEIAFSSKESNQVSYIVKMSDQPKDQTCKCGDNCQCECKTSDKACKCGPNCKCSTKGSAKYCNCGRECSCTCIRTNEACKCWETQ